jgi:hypothetical protein
LIVRKGLVFKHDTVVPINLVERSDRSEVRLSPALKDPQSLPEYNEQHYIMAGERDWVTEPDQVGVTPANVPVVAPTPLLYWYPPLGVGAPGMMPPPSLAKAADGPRRDSGMVLERKRNIPPDTVPLKEGAKVIAADGAHVGRVARLFTEPGTDKLTHVLISTGLLGNSHKVIPMAWVIDVGEDEIRLAVGSNLLDGLKEYQERDGAG